MFSQTDIRTKNLRANFRAIISLRHCEGTPEAIQSKLQLAWKGVYNGIHEETQQLEKFLIESIDNKFKTFYGNDAGKIKTIGELTRSTTLLHHQYHEHINKNFKSSEELLNKDTLNNLYFLTHYIDPDQIENCLLQKEALYDFLQQDLMMRLGNDYHEAYHQTKLLLLLKSWGRVLPKEDLPNNHLLLTKTKTQFLLNMRKKHKEHDFQIFLQFYDFCNAASQRALTPQALIVKLKSQCAFQRVMIQLQESHLSNMSHSEILQAYGSHLYHSFYYVEISDLLLNAADDLVQFRYKNIGSALMSLGLLWVTRQEYLTLSYMGVQALTKVLFDEFDLMHSLVENFAGDETTVLRYLSWAQNICRYVLLMGITCAVSGSGSLAAATFLHCVYESIRFLHEQSSTPYFEKLCEQHEEYKNLLQLLHFTMILLSSVLAGKAIDHLMSQFNETELKITPCNITRAYEELSLSSNSTSHDVYYAWKTAAKIYHPDHGSDGTAFVTKSSAYACLSQAGLAHRPKRTSFNDQ